MAGDRQPVKYVSVVPRIKIKPSSPYIPITGFSCACLPAKVTSIRTQLQKMVEGCSISCYSRHTVSPRWNATFILLLDAVCKPLMYAMVKLPFRTWGESGYERGRRQFDAANVGGGLQPPTNERFHVRGIHGRRSSPSSKKRQHVHAQRRDDALLLEHTAKRKKVRARHGAGAAAMQCR